MKASLVSRERFDLADDTFVETVIWSVPRPLPGSTHKFKYRLALMREGVCVLRYDNEAGKGDHKHIGKRENPYAFSDLYTLQVDFWTDVDIWLKQR